MHDHLKSVEIRIPSFTELLDAIPQETHTPQLRSSLLAAYQAELSTMLSYALDERCVQPRIEMNLWREAGDQRIAEFAVSDLSLPLEPQTLNFHGQNTSRWYYAGAIVVEGAHVSRHH